MSDGQAKWLSDYHYSRLTGHGGTTNGGAAGLVDHMRDQEGAAARSSGSGVGSGSGLGVALGQGLIGGFVALSVWCAGFWPLQQLNQFALMLGKTDWKLKAWPTGIGLVLGAFPPVWNELWPGAWAIITASTGHWNVLVGSAVGGFLGSILIPMVAAALMMTVMVIAMLLAIVIIAALSAIVYLAIAAYAGWSPFDRSPSVPPIANIEVIANH